MRTILIILGVVLAAVFLIFGTVSPCGIVRAEIRREAAREGEFSGFLASALPDSVIDGILSAQYGTLTPGRCIVLALGGISQPIQPPQPQPTPVASQFNQPRSYTPVPTPNPIEAVRQATQLANAAITECRNKRLSGELKSYVASAQCSNPRIIEVYQKANYRYMDLIYQMTSERLVLAEETDQGKITEGQGQLAYSQFLSGLVERERQRDRGQR